MLIQLNQSEDSMTISPSKISKRQMRKNIKKSMENSKLFISEEKKKEEIEDILPPM